MSRIILRAQDTRKLLGIKVIAADAWTQQNRQINSSLATEEKFSVGKIMQEGKKRRRPSIWYT
jgi:hypothetical protein